MKKLILITLMALAPFSAFAQVTPAKVAELTAHRIDRLVTLGKIDATFNTRLEKVEVTVAGPAPVAYRSLVSQTQPTTGTPIQLEILFDAAAKPLSFKLIPGGVAGPDPKWTGANAVSLFENSLHEVLENAKDIQIAPFYTGLTTVTLSQVSANGMNMAQSHITSADTTKKMNVYLMLDGSFMSTEIIP